MEQEKMPPAGICNELANDGDEATLKYIVCVPWFWNEHPFRAAFIPISVWNVSVTAMVPLTGFELTPVAADGEQLRHVTGRPFSGPGGAATGWPFVIGPAGTRTMYPGTT